MNSEVSISGVRNWLGQKAASATISKERWAKLEAFLGNLPVSATSRLLTVLERDRARGGGGLPHDDIISILRNSLLEQRAPFPARAKTAQRLFFTPFEDFITPQRRGRKRRARIARSSLDAIWRLLMNDPACTAAARAAAALDGALLQGTSDIGEPMATDDLENALFEAAADGFGRLITHAESDGGFRADLSERLGGGIVSESANVGAATLHDLAEINLLLPSVRFLKTMQEYFPKPVLSLTEEELFTARRIYADAQGANPEAGPYVLLCLAGRMETPWRAMSVYYHLSRSRDKSLLSAREDASAVAETLLDDLEGMVRSLEREGERELDANDAAGRLAYVAEFAEGMIREAKSESDGVITNRVEACREVAAQALERFTEQSLASIRKALPTRHAGGSSRLMSLRPDINREIDGRLLTNAGAAASFLSDSTHLSGQLNRSNTEDAILVDAVEYVRRYTNDLVLEIRAAEGEDRVSAKRMMEASLTVAEPLLTPSEIALLRDKAAAAAVTA